MVHATVDLNVQKENEQVTLPLCGNEKEYSFKTKVSRRAQKLQTPAVVLFCLVSVVANVYCVVLTRQTQNEIRKKEMSVSTPAGDATTGSDMNSQALVNNDVFDGNGVESYEAVTKEVGYFHKK